MHLIGLLLTLHLIATQLFLSLGGTEQIGGQFGRPHVIQYSLTFFQTFPLMNGPLIEAAIKPLITMILEDSEIETRFDPSLLRSFN